MQDAIWIKGKRKITGSWTYNWAQDPFYVYLDSRDPITGIKRTIPIKGDKPEWGGWKIIEKKSNDI